LATKARNVARLRVIFDCISVKEIEEIEEVKRLKRLKD
jgi:hypothetical protein